MSIREKSILAFYKLAHSPWFPVLTTFLVVCLFVKLLLFSAGGSVLNLVVYLVSFALIVGALKRWWSLFVGLGIVILLAWYLFYA